MRRPAVFFDRDNTLIVGSEYLGDPDGVVLVAGAPAAIAKCRAMGYAVVIVSNQSGVARGMFTEDDVRAVNRRMDQLLLEANPNAVVDRHEYCPFHPEAKVEAYRQDSFLRKPKPGMILAAADAMALDLSRSWLVGDAPRDIAAGKAAGCRTILIVDPTLTPSPAALEASTVPPDFTVGSLIEAIEVIARQTERSHAALTPWDRSAQTEPEMNNTAEPDDSPAAPEQPVQQAQQPTPTPASANTASQDRPPTVVADRVGPIAAALVSQPLVSQQISQQPGASSPAPSAAAQPPANPPRSTPAAATPAPSTPAPASAPATPAPAPTPAAASPFAVSKPPAAKPAAKPAPVPSAAARPAPAQQRPAVAPQPGAGKLDLSRLEATAQQILMELKKLNEARVEDFSISKLVAGIMQILAIAIVPLGYMLHKPSDPAQLANWLLVAVFLQTFTVALLIMGRQR